MPDAPRFYALRGLAKSQADFDRFCADAMVYVEPDASRRAVVLSHTRTCAGAIEQWLKRMGSVADPAMLRSMPHNQDAGDLLHSCLSISQQLFGGAPPDSGAGGSSSGGLSAAASAPVRVVVRSSTDSDTLSEHEKRERGALQADVLALERDAASRAKLRAWAADAASGDETRHSLMTAAVELEPAGELRRLLYSGAEVSSVTVDAEAQTTQDIAVVRGVLDAALERSVFGKAASRQPDRVIRALRYVRTFKIGKVRLGHLCDVDDSSTEANPL
eukprot:104601-Prymnesium_polylepis.1